MEYVKPSPTILLLTLCFALAAPTGSLSQGSDLDAVSAVLELHFGGPGSDGANSIVPLSDGGFALGGWKARDGEPDVTESWIIRLDNRGRYIWDLPLPQSAPYGVSAMASALDGGLLIIDGELDNRQGRTRLSKISPNGSVEQQPIFGNSAADQISAIRPTFDGGLIMVGQAYRGLASRSDGWVIKLDRNMTVQWFRIIAGPVVANADNALEDIIVLTDGSFVAVGWLTDENDRGHGWVIKLAPGGNTLWQYVRDLGPNTEIHKILAAPNNKAVIASTTATDAKAGRKIVLAGLSEDGDFSWQQGIASGGTALATGLTRVDRTSYLLSASIEDQQGQAGLVVAFSSNGTLNKIQRHTGGSIHRALTVTATSDAGYAVAGSSKRTNSLDQDMWLLIKPGNTGTGTTRPSAAP